MMFFHLQPSSFPSQPRTSVTLLPTHRLTRTLLEHRRTRIFAMKNTSNIVFPTLGKSFTASSMVPSPLLTSIPVMNDVNEPSAAVTRFADVPSFEFDFGGTNVIDHHELNREKHQPWKAVCEMIPVGPEESVFVGISPCKPYFAESGNAGGW